ncbi:hypothetical protein C5167_031244 [Papaver somniferum]|nr:hypothetical protein C5167_031244 [Papaver somniferum]
MAYDVHDQQKEDMYQHNDIYSHAYISSIFMNSTIYLHHFVSKRRACENSRKPCKDLLDAIQDLNPTERERERAGSLILQLGIAIHTLHRNDTYVYAGVRLLAGTTTEYFNVLISRHS